MSRRGEKGVIESETVNVKWRKWETDAEEERANAKIDIWQESEKKSARKWERGKDGKKA